MLDFLRFWMPMVVVVLLLLIFICGYAEAIFLSWGSGSLPESFSTLYRTKIRKADIADIYGFLAP
jgi:hypothetical protein